MSDMFSFMTGSSAGPSKKKKQSAKPSNGGWSEHKGLVIRINEKSVLFFDDASVQEIFIPLSQVKDWWFTSDGGKRGLRLQDLELDDEVTICLPRWLAFTEGMVQ